MRAVFYDRTGKAEDVLVVGELPDPHAGDGEVRVRLRWSGVNPVDVKFRAGVAGPMAFPRIVPHHDGMGAIDEVGAGVDPARLGRRVWTWNAAYRRPAGTAADYVVLPAGDAIDLPDDVPDDVAACLGTPALTALHAVMSDGGVAGKRLLVAGGAGAVGFYAIQFARLLGAADVVATVSSEAKAAVAAGAGASLCVNYREEPVAERVRAHLGGKGVDRVVEVDIGANARYDFDVLGPRGELVVYGSSAREFTVPFLPMLQKSLAVRAFGVYSVPPAEHAAEVSRLGGWLREGRVRHLIDSRFPLSATAEAHRRVSSGQAVGNVLVEIGG